MFMKKNIMPVGHTHNHSFHTFCLATVVYNILVVAVEICLQLLFTGHDAHEVMHFEFFVQVFHIVGTALLGIVQWRIMHKMEKQTPKKFAIVSIIMLAIHVVVLHLLPRLLGFSLHDHGIIEIKEVIILFVIVLIVTVLFWKREDWLKKIGLKNRRVINIRHLITKKPL
jgi:membrane protein DedA with SNARE-associated domain